MPSVFKDVSQTSVQHLTIAGALAFACKYWLNRPWLCSISLFLSVSTPIFADIFGAFFFGKMTDALAQQVNGSRDLSAAVPALLFQISGWAYYWYGVHARSFLRNSMEQHNLYCFFCDLSAHVQKLDIEWHNSTLSGSTVRAINRGMWGLNDLGNLVFTNFIPTIAVMSGGLIMLFSVQPLFGWIMAGFTLPYAALSILSAAYYIGPQQQDALRKESRGSGVLADAIGGNAVIKAFAAEQREASLLSGFMHVWAQSVRRAWDREDGIGVCQVTIMIAFRVIFVGMALWQWRQGALSVGGVTFLISLQFDVFSYLRDLGLHIRRLQKSVSDMDEAIALFALKPEPSDAPGPPDLVLTKGAIEFQDVSFSYKGQDQALYQNLSLKLEPGQSVALVGRSGGGKSTLIKLMQRYYEIQHGRILLDGQDISSVTRASLRQSIALVPQDPVLFHRSIFENISYARPEATTNEVEEAARLAHAHDFIGRLPQGYQTIVGERGVKLSGGERQRVAIARAILANSPILILDEATSSLDSESERHIQNAFAWLMKNRTTIVIAHRLSTVCEADRVLVFDHGRIVEDGTHESLLSRRNGIYRALYRMQSGGFLGDQAEDS